MTLINRIKNENHIVISSVEKHLMKSNSSIVENSGQNSDRSITP